MNFNIFAKAQLKSDLVFLANILALSSKEMSTESFGSFFATIYRSIRETIYRLILILLFKTYYCNDRYSITILKC
jgi:hypothetical protein